MDIFNLGQGEEIEIILEANGASLKDIRRIEEELGITFPDDYVRFMQQSNGGTIVPGESSEIMLYPIEYLVDDRETDIQLYEGCIFFGSDGGLESYVFDVRTSAVSIVEVDRVAGMESAIPAGRNLQELVIYVLHKFDDFDKELPKL